MSRITKTQMKQNMDMMFNPSMEGGMEDIEKGLYGNVEGDADLEAELAALMGGGATSPVRSQRQQPAKKAQHSIVPTNILKQIEDLDNDDDDIDFDENDPELMAELAGVVGEDTSPVRHPSPQAPAHGPSLLPLIESRIQMYQEAISVAKEENETSKAKRYERALGTLQQQFAKVKKGGAVDEEDIPPAVTVKRAPPTHKPSGEARLIQAVNPPAPSAPKAPAPSTSRGVNQATLQGLLSRQQEFKSAALVAKKNGNLEEAKEFLSISKQFDGAIQAVQGGEDFDLSDMPPSPVPSPPAQSAPAPAPVAAPSRAASSSITLMEALQIRHNAFKDIESKSNAEGNTSKARRYGRIVQQYTEAMQACRSKKPYDYDSLPAPPGADPLPSPSGPSTAPRVSVPHAGAAPPPPKLSRSLSRSGNQQLVFLQDRQQKFKMAALQAKKRGDLEMAKRLLRESKGFDQVILAAESGLPVDLSKMPSLPGEQTIDLHFLEAEEIEGPAELLEGDRDSQYSQLAALLTNQIKMCQDNANRCSKMGDPSTASMFTKLGKSCLLDLASVKNANQHGDPVPRFHFENKTLSVSQSNPDLGDDEMEVTLVKGVDLALPDGYRADQLDTYVRMELPLPNDAPQVFTSDVVKKTNSPQYDFVVKFNINRKSRAFLRVVQSRGLKMEVFYRRGILKKDALLGTALLKMPQLERQCFLHQSCDLTEGRRTIGGKLEMKARLREPITGKQVNQVREKWLVIDSFNRPSHKQSQPASSSTIESIEVLKYEWNILREKKEDPRCTPAQQSAISAKQKQIEGAIHHQDKALKEGGTTEIRRYVTGIQLLVQKYLSEAQAAMKQGERSKAQELMTKKKLVESELSKIKGNAP